MVMRIKELRVAAGLNQTELGVQMGVSQSTVAEWECEAYLPKSRQLPLMARVFGTSIDELFVPIEDVS